MNENLERQDNQFKAGINESTTDPVNSTQVETKMTEVVTEEETEQKFRVEELKISGDTLVAKVRELIHQGNIRRIIIKNEEGRTLIEIPLTVGVVGGVIGAAMFPVIAAIGAIGAVVAHLTLVVERKE
ncbi:DUF4342 domain-containing protein [Argonema antarcticum]|uniref:DUF4342 domain-containing protein n=1 Tax=Argonema antarcticum TaxID=2942763 RepID=UPI002010FBBA|nr:DUF4342 domain-containing protein [Argonema antarcticum]MCL1473372.1 DUF4342 domain-containing protein [Argonema antarcticum A004/B2]